MHHETELHHFHIGGKNQMVKSLPPWKEPPEAQAEHGEARLRGL
jgi:hypothetical protein